jgi:hypothetical protein
MVEAKQSNITIQQRKGVTEVDTQRKEIIHETESGTTVGVGRDYHHDDSGIVRVAQTFAKGEIPSNVEMSSTMEKAKITLSQQQPDLSDHGKRLAQDAVDVIESAEKLLENKNPDEGLQKIVKEANLLAQDSAQKGAREAEKLSNQSFDSTSVLLKQTINNTSDLAYFLLKSSDFRGFMFDSLELFQSMLRDIDRKHGDSLVEGIKSDVNREDSNISATKDVASNLADDIREGRLGDEGKKQSLEDRFEDLLMRLSQNPQYNQALNNMFQLFDQLKDKFGNLAPATQYDPNDRFSNITWEAWNIMARFVNEGQMYEFRDKFWGLYNEMKDDMEARQFFFDLQQYVLTLMQNPDEVTDEYRKRQAKDFVDRGKQLFRSGQNKYQDSFNELFNLTGDMLSQIRDDPDTQRFTQSVGQLAKDFFTDEQGRPDIFVTQESIQQLRDMVIPVIQKQLEHVPLPMIEGSNDKYDWRLDNLTLFGRDILPDTFDLKMSSNLMLGHKHKDDKSVSKLQVTGKRIRLAFNDFNFWYHRKTIPRIEDNGVADLKMLGNGLSFKIVWKLWVTENRPFTIALDSVKVWIDKLDINIKHSKHSFINKLATKMFSGMIKRKVAQSIVDQIKDSLEPMNDQLNDFFRKERDSHNLKERANVQLKRAFDVNISDKLKETADSFKEKAESVKEDVKEKVSEVTSSQESFSSGGSYSQKPVITGKYVNIESGENFIPLGLRTEESTVTRTTFSSGESSKSELEQKIDNKEHPFDQTMEKLEGKLFGTNEGKYHGEWRARPVTATKYPSIPKSK